MRLLCCGLVASGILGAQNTPAPPTALRQLELFVDRCPSNDPAIAQIRADFEILRDGLPVNEFPCSEPYTRSTPAQFDSRTFLLQALRFTYYLDQGRTGHLPWTNLRLYDWIKSRLSGFHIRSNASIHSCCELINTRRFATFAGAPLDDLNRSYRMSITGLLANIALLAHEARHADGYPHVSCCGVANGCDQNYDERDLSPYGIQNFLQRAWLTGNGFNLNLGCLDPAIHRRFPLAVSDANLYEGRFCGTRPPLLPASTVIGGSCQSGEFPQVSLGGIVNVANLRPEAIAVGSAISIYGRALAQATEEAGTLPLATTRQGVSVTIGGRPAPLFYISPGQLNAQVPYDAPREATELVVTANGNVGYRRAITVLPVAPAIFTLPNNFVIAQLEDGSLNSSENPSRIGSVFVTYFTGQGLSDNPVRSGDAAPGNPLARPVAPVRLSIGGRAQEVLFAGLTPGFVGLSQANVRVVSGTPTGVQPIILTLDTFSSVNTARIAIAP